MRKLSLKTHCQYRLRNLSKTNTLDIKKLQQECETSNIRLFVPLLVHCYINHRNVDSPSQLSQELEKMKLFNPEMDENEILEYLKNTEDYESVRFVQSFRSRNLRKNNVDRKKVSLKIITMYIDEFSLSIKNIADLGQCDYRNLSFFIKKKDFNRLSKKKCDFIVHKLIEVYGPVYSK